MEKYPITLKWGIEVVFQNEVDVYTTVTLPDTTWATFHSQITPEGPKLLEIVKFSEGLNESELRQAFLTGQLMMTPASTTTLQ